MKKALFALAGGSLGGCVVCAGIYAVWDIGLFLSLAITCGTFAYHFVMRLAVGYAIHACCRNRMNYRRRWFAQRGFEPALYKALRVKRWKAHMPTFESDFFSLNTHTVEEIVQSMCQAEVVHEVIVVLSFVPLLFSLVWGEFAVFCITSVLAALFDLLFVIMQRYNRPRLIRMMRKRP